MTDRQDLTQASALLSVLREFERAPGRFPLSLREPRLLFDHANTLLLMATGRLVNEMHTHPYFDHPDEVQRAARYFIRAALLQPNSDHYTLLGLSAKASHEAVRDHYRLMIRLTHPDFDADGEHWPADAASRINIANDVLSSPAKRAEYDALRATATASAPQVQPSHRPPVIKNKGVARPKLRPSPKSEAPWFRLLSPRSTAVVGAFSVIAGATAVWLLKPVEQGSLTSHPRSVNEETESYVEPGRLPAGAPREPASTISASPAASRKSTASLPQGVSPPSINRHERGAPPKVAVAAVPSTATDSVVAAGQNAPLPAQPPRELAVSSPAPASQPAPDAGVPQSAGLSMAQVHPALTNVVGSLYSGKGESLAQWIDRDWQTLPANHAFVTQYNQWLSGQRVTQLGKISFRSRSVGDQLIVDGLVEMHIQDSQNTVQVRDLQLRAYFQPVNGRPILTQLAASQAR